MAVVGNWTYSGDPRDSDRDAVRYLIGDTNEDDQLVSDEEIAYLLTLNSVPLRAAANAARGISASYAAKVKHKSVGDLSITYEERATKYSELATRLDGMANSGLIAIAAYAGGISKADKETQVADTDWDKPWFYRGQFDHPGSDWPLGGSTE